MKPGVLESVKQNRSKSPVFGFHFKPFHVNLLSPLNIINQDKSWLSTYKEKYVDPRKPKLKKQYCVKPCDASPVAHKKIDLSYNKSVLDMMRAKALSKQNITTVNLPQKTENTSKAFTKLMSRSIKVVGQVENLENSIAYYQDSYVTPNSPIKPRDITIKHQLSNVNSDTSKHQNCVCFECKIKVIKRIDSNASPQKLLTTYKADFSHLNDPRIIAKAILHNDEPLLKQMPYFNSSYNRDFQPKVRENDIRANLKDESDADERQAAPFSSLTNYKMSFPKWDIPKKFHLKTDNSSIVRLKMPFIGKASNSNYGDFDQSLIVVRDQSKQPDNLGNPQLDRIMFEKESTSKRCFKSPGPSSTKNIINDKKQVQIHNEEFAGRFKTTYEEISKRDASIGAVTSLKTGYRHETDP